MNEIGKYIYGIINSNTALRFFVPREYPSTPLRAGSGQVPTDSEEKKPAVGVYTVPYQDISAVVCDSPVVEYTNMPRDAVARLLIRHQKVIEGIMTLEHIVIPLRLGTFARDDEEVKEILHKGYSLIKDIMAKASEKIEIDVVATWSDFASVLKEISEEKEVREFREKALANPGGVAVEEQMKVGVLVKKALDKKREKYTGEIIDALSKLSGDFKTHELMDDKMVVNIAFLIKTQVQKDFDKKIEELNAGFTEKINFRYVGPLPPYSFYTLQIKRLQFEELGWARKKLGLDGLVITREEIKKAHRVKAICFHPDKNPNVPGVEKEFDEVTRAYKVLLDYCRDDSCSFKKEDFRENSIIMKVRQ